MSEGRVIGAVFARGGSKGIPGKNLRRLGERSLLVHALEALAAVRRVARIVVSTDDAAIAQAAGAWGAEVIDRPASLATDAAPEWLAWQHLVDAMGPEWGDNPGDILLSAPTTAPLRLSADLDAALDRFAVADIDAVLAVTPAARNPYFNMVRLNSAGMAELLLSPPVPISRRQDAPAVFDVTTVVFGARARFVRAATRLYDGRVGAIVVPVERAVDIDTEVDLLTAEVLLARSMRTGGRA